VAQMQNHQAEYDQKINIITQEVTAFTKNDDITQFETVAAEARELQERLKEATEMARTFNMREQLTDNDETSYENVFAL